MTARWLQSHRILARLFGLDGSGEGGAFGWLESVAGVTEKAA